MQEAVGGFETQTEFLKKNFQVPPTKLSQNIELEFLNKSMSLEVNLKAHCGTQISILHRADTLLPFEKRLTFDFIASSSLRQHQVLRHEKSLCIPG